MAKSMALIENGTVANMLWCSDSEPETESLINPADRPVAIGDTYSGGKFYRDGVEICWQEITLQDAVDLAEARLKNAQARQIEASLGEEALHSCRNRHH